MAGPNPTGLPRTQDYNLGRGILYVAPIDVATGRPKAYRDLGNATAFTITIDEETLEHLSSREGLKTVDKEVTISRAMSLGWTLDEINHENMGMFFGGVKSTHTNPAVAGITSYEWIVGNETSLTDLELGRWYDLRASNGNRAYDIDPTKITLTTTAGSPVTLVNGTDFKLDEVMGRVFFYSTSTAVATAIAAWQGINLVLTADATSKHVDQVGALTDSPIPVALKFVATNPANSDIQTEFQFHQVTAKPEGEFSLIGDEWTTMEFTGKAEKNTLVSPTSPTLTVRNLKP